MPRIKLTPEERLRRRRERDRITNARRTKTPRILLTEEEKRERKRACDRRYDAKIRNLQKKSTYKSLSESKQRHRKCRHELHDGHFCGKDVVHYSYYYCSDHKRLYINEDVTIYSIVEMNIS